MQIISNNLSALGLELSPSKSVFFHFSRNNILPGDDHIEIDSHKIFSSDSVKFLGIYLDYKLNFSKHVAYIRKKCLSFKYD